VSCQLQEKTPTRKSHDAKSAHSPSRATMSTRTGSARFGRVALVGVVGWIVRRFRRVRVPDPYRPIFDPGLDIATVVFSHVQCIKTRHSLARVSKLWRDASEPAAAYPRTFDFDAFPDMDLRLTRVIDMLNNDEALSLPYERVVGLLGRAANPVLPVCHYAASRGSVRLLKWDLHENGCHWDSDTCLDAALNGHLPALQYLHENGCPWDFRTCHYAAQRKHWDCLQYAVDNKCGGHRWEEYAKKHAKHLR
jgi:hypothetical protein